MGRTIKYLISIVLACVALTFCERVRPLHDDKHVASAEKQRSPLPSPKRFQPIEEAVFAGPDCAWVVTGHAELLRTEDSGKNWEKTPAETIDGFAHVAFINSKQGWAINYQ